MTSSSRREIAGAPLRASVLDRLMAPPATSGAVRRALEVVGLRELRAAVARDLEWLLNTKQCLPDVPEDLVETMQSIWTYGLPDLSTYSSRSPEDATTLARLLEDVIRRFEPRLRPGSVRITPRPGGEGDEFRVQFRIDAILHVEPIRSPVSFDTDVDFGAGTVRVRGEG
jgi:type VI secretion system protein ImpF